MCERWAVRPVSLLLRGEQGCSENAFIRTFLRPARTQYAKDFAAARQQQHAHHRQEVPRPLSRGTAGRDFAPARVPSTKRDPAHTQQPTARPACETPRSPFLLPVPAEGRKGVARDSAGHGEDYPGLVRERNFSVKGRNAAGSEGSEGRGALVSHEGSAPVVRAAAHSPTNGRTEAHSPTPLERNNMMAENLKETILKQLLENGEEECKPTPTTRPLSGLSPDFGRHLLKHEPAALLDWQDLFHNDSLARPHTPPGPDLWARPSSRRRPPPQALHLDVEPLEPCGADDSHGSVDGGVDSGADERVVNASYDAVCDRTAEPAVAPSPRSTTPLQKSALFDEPQSPQSRESSSPAAEHTHRTLSPSSISLQFRRDDTAQSSSGHPGVAPASEGPLDILYDRCLVHSTGPVPSPKATAAGAFSGIGAGIDHEARYVVDDAELRALRDLIQ